MRRRRAQTIASSIRMKRQLYSGAFLVVEGRDDRLFMEAFICRPRCRIVVAESKQRVLEVVHILENANFRGVVGIVDSDFDRIRRTRDESRNILSYQCHDLETMLVFSPALNRVIVEFGSTDKIAALGESVLDALVRKALLIGHLRLHSVESRLNLRFQDLNYSRWIDHRTFTGTINQLVTVVKNHSRQRGLSSAPLISAICDLMSNNFPAHEVCEGTDLIEILAIGLRSKFGSQRRSSDVGGNILRRTLRLGFSKDMLEASEFGKSIRSWESRSHNFQILRR